MSRRTLTVLVLAACLAIVAGIHARAQGGGPAGANGLRIVRTSELRVAPGAATDASGEIARALQARKANLPPDGIARSTIYLKGSAIRVEHAAPNAAVTICPARSKNCYSIRTQDKTFTRFPARLSAAGWDVESRPTGAIEAIASLPAEEVRYSARRVIEARGMPERTPRSQVNRDDGYTDRDTYALPDSATRDFDTGITREGRMWLVNLPPGGDTARLAAFVLGPPVYQVAGRRFPARHVWQVASRARPADLELLEKVESIESVPLDDGLFQLSAGLREVPLRRPSGR